MLLAQTANNNSDTFVYNNYELQHLSINPNQYTITRMGFITAGDTAPLQYTLLQGVCDAADNGSEVQPINSAGVPLPWCWQASLSGQWSASEFGVTAAVGTNPQSNSDALNAMCKAAYTYGLPAFIDINATIPYNGMTCYSHTTLSANAQTTLQMQQDGFGLLLLPSPGANPGEVQRFNLNTFNIDMNGHNGSAYMLQSIANSTIDNIQWKGVYSGTYPYNDGVASGSFPDAAITIKCVDSGQNECWWNKIKNFRSNDGAQKTAGTCSTATLTISDTTNINDLGGTVYVVDRTNGAALPSGTTVLSHDATTVTLSNACTSVAVNDAMFFTTAAVEIELITTAGHTSTVPNAETFDTGYVHGGAIGINNILGGHNTYLAVDVSLNGHGSTWGGLGRAVQGTFISFSFMENESIDGINITTDGQDTWVYRTGGTTNTTTPITDNGSNTIYGGHFMIGNGNNIVMEADTAGNVNNALRLRNQTAASTTLTLMPGDTAAGHFANIRMMNSGDQNNVGWIDQTMNGNNAVSMSFAANVRGTGVKPTTMNFSGLKVTGNGLSAASSGTHALCINPSTFEWLMSSTATCP